MVQNHEEEFKEGERKEKKKKREREESGEKEAELNNRDGKDTERDGGGEKGRKE